MRPFVHLTCGTILAVGNYIVSREKESSFACALGAVLCDTDHIIEYAEYCRTNKVRPDFEEWSSGEYFSKKGTVKVFFHSWELCLLSWILLWALGLSVRDSGAKGFDGRIAGLLRVFRGLTMGYTSHMILDQLGNGLRGKSYFLLYRKHHRWKQGEL